MAKKIRVYELAHELGLSNKEGLDLCLAMGIGVSSHSSSIEDAQADRVRRKAEREGLKRSHQPPEPQTGTPEVSPSPSLVGRSGGVAGASTRSTLPPPNPIRSSRSEGGVAAAPPPGVLVPGEAPGFHDAAQTARRPVPATTATSSRPSADVRHDLGCAWPRPGNRARVRAFGTRCSRNSCRRAKPCSARSGTPRPEGVRVRFFGTRG